VLRQTMRQRLQAKLSEVKAELRRRMHDPIPEVGKWLRSVVGGHLRYYGVPMNNQALHLLRFQVGRHWHRGLARRSQTGRIHWDRMQRLIDRWLPPPAFVILIRCGDLGASPEARAGCGNAARPDLWRVAP
jgi:RNA-directed DNA polymerase